MADFKRRFKDLLGFGGNESVAYDDSAEEDYDYSDYDETEDLTEDEAPEDTYVSSERYSSRAAASASAPNARPRATGSRASENSYRGASAGSSERSRILNMGATSNLRVVLSKPMEFDDCQGVCSHLRGHMTVVLNLEFVRNVADRRRIFDFVSGCCFALDCNIQRVSELIYVIAPCDVDIFSEAEDDEENSSYMF
ncbi:MAG: cell division protein SepF [Clostridia bacterium]